MEMKAWRKSQLLRRAAIVAGWFVVPAAEPRPHEKWFHNAAPHPTHWKLAYKYPTTLGVAIAIGLTGLIAVLARSLSAAPPNAEGARDTHPLMPGIRSSEMWNHDWGRTHHDKLA